MKITENNFLEKKKGEMFIFIEGFLWAFFPIIAILSYGKLPSLISLAYSTLFSSIFFGIIVLYKKKWKEFLNPLLWKYVILVVFFIGVLYYGFFYIGLTQTTAGNASIIALFEIFTSFFLFHIFKKETISFDYKIGILLMIIGAVIVLGRDFGKVNIGDIFILAATFCAPMGNYYQQKVIKIASSETIMFLRNLLSFPIIFLIAYFLNQHASFENVKSSLLFLLVNGVLIFGISKLLWIEAIHRISVTKALALNSLTPLLTLFVAWIFLKQVPNSWQFISLIPLFIGVLFLTDNLRFSKVKIA